jgi:DNA-binding NarL/FixJ family response regulator
MLRIFVADDHLLIRGGLRTLFRNRRDFSICGESDNGREAVALAIAAKPDILIVNINLPGINGIEATRQVRERSPDTEILIFTAENNEDLMREALRAGARGYLLKSASDEQVIAAIDTLAGHQRYFSSAVSGKLIDRLAERKRGESNGAGAGLTMREREIVGLVAEGHRGKEIAQMLGISLKTVETHRAAAMRKLDLRSVAEVVRYAVRTKLIKV